MSSSLAYPNLSEPVQLGAIKTKHRVFMSSLTRNRAMPGTVPNDSMLKYYQQRARDGGAGLIFAEGTLISPQGTEWPYAPGIWDEEQAQAWKKIVDAVHAEGTPIVMQLWHLGRISHPDMPEQKRAGVPVYAPSAISARGGKFRELPGEPGYVTPTELPEDKFETILDQYENAAKMAKIAGFDGVELHSANGYLMDQFLSDEANKRTDQYGGSPENRARFPLAVIERLIKVYGADRVGVKVAPCGGYNDMGFTSPEARLETFHYYIQQLDALKLAYLQITQYNAFGDPKFDGKPVGYDHNVVTEYSKDVKNSVFITNCGYDGEKASKEIEGGKVQGVAFGQGFIPNPDYYKRIQENLPLGQPDYHGFYVAKDGNPDIGYNDYPFADESAKK